MKKATKSLSRHTKLVVKQARKLKMDIRFSESLGEVDWSELAAVFKLAPLGDRDPEKLRVVFTQSTVRCFVWCGKTLIGAGRAISDGVAYTVVFDVVLLPEWQKKGIGHTLVEHLILSAKAPSVMLYAVPGKEAFYRKLGFRKMTTAMARFADPQAKLERGYIE